MPDEIEKHAEHVMCRLRQVQNSLEMPPARDDGVDLPLTDQLDSMGLVEYFAVLAEDYCVAVSTVETAAQAGSASLGELAASLQQQGLSPSAASVDSPTSKRFNESVAVKAWLSAPAMHLPRAVQTANQIDKLLGRPIGWFKRHAGISQRHLWNDEDPLTAAMETGLACIQTAQLKVEDVQVLLVTSEAPPILAGLAAGLHHKIGLRQDAVAVEVGGACTGFLSAVWLAQQLLHKFATAMILAVEAPSRYLTVKPGPTGEAAALFGDGVVACIMSKSAIDMRSLPLLDVQVQSHGQFSDHLQVKCAGNSPVVQMEGTRLASIAIATMAKNVDEAFNEHVLTPDQFQAVIAHGGNGRMPSLLARRLGLPQQCVWSQTESAGNLGSASLPAAWAAREQPIRRPLIWAAVGAGLSSAWALTGNAGGQRVDAELPF